MNNNNIIWKKNEQNVNSIKFQEDFFFGERRVHLVNPVYVDFEKTSCDLYKKMFEELAGASREYYTLEKKLSSLEYQKKLVKDYLGENSVTKIANCCNISYTTISEVKRGVRSIDNLSFDKFEKILKVAIEEKNHKKSY